MNTLDIIILAIMVLGLAKGFYTGFIKSFVNVIGWLLALVLGSYFAADMAPWITNNVPALSAKLSLVLGFLMIVLAVISLLTIISFIMNQLLETLNLKILDRVAGGVFGAAKGLLVVLVMMSLTAPMMQRFAIWQQSQLVPELMPLAPIATKLSKDVWQQSMDDLNNGLGKSLATAGTNNANSRTQTASKSSIEPQSENSTLEQNIENMQQTNDTAFE